MNTASDGDAASTVPAALADDDDDGDDDDDEGYDDNILLLLIEMMINTPNYLRCYVSRWTNRVPCVQTGCVLATSTHAFRGNETT